MRPGEGEEFLSGRKRGAPEKGFVVPHPWQRTAVLLVEKVRMVPGATKCWCQYPEEDLIHEMAQLVLV